MKWTKTTTFSISRAHIRYANHPLLPANPLMWIDYEGRSGPAQLWKHSHSEFIICNTKRQWLCNREDDIPAMVHDFLAATNKRTA